MLASALAVVLVLVLVLVLLEAAYGVVAWTVQHTQPQPHKHTHTQLESDHATMSHSTACCTDVCKVPQLPRHILRVGDEALHHLGERYLLRVAP